MRDHGEGKLLSFNRCPRFVLARCASYRVSQQSLGHYPFANEFDNFMGLSENWSAVNLLNRSYLKYVEIEHISDKY